MLCNAPFWLKLAHSAQILAFSTKIFLASWLACKCPSEWPPVRIPLWTPKNFQIFFLSHNIYKLIYNVSHTFLSLFNVKRLVIGKKVHFQPIVQPQQPKSKNFSGVSASTFHCRYNSWYFCRVFSFQILGSKGKIDFVLNNYFDLSKFKNWVQIFFFLPRL